jgi:prepilin-type N-terminal cleavage/methylation domain-containing protein
LVVAIVHLDNRRILFYLICRALHAKINFKEGFVKFRREGWTLIEIIVVLVIIGLAIRFVSPDFTASKEQALAISARNNLLAIYSAEMNYLNNNGKYCLGTGSATPACGNSLANLNFNLSLLIQDDGTYTYDCSTATTCVAKRANALLKPLITVTLNAPIQLNGANPTCVAAAGQTNWCP